jgi:hypothetical protein
MTFLEALAILEVATLECKKRDVHTPEVRETLDLLQPHVRPQWLIPQYRHALDGHGDREYDREGQQQVLRRALTASGIQSAIYWGCIWINWRDNSPLLTT